MISRRQLLVRLSRTVLGAAILEFSPFLVRRANAIAPLVVVAIAQAAISAAKLFSHDSEGVGSLLQLQVAMLQAIQSELSVIESELRKILENLEELRKSVADLPNKVVIEQNRAAVEGLIQLYDEVKDTYVDQGGVMTERLFKELDDRVIGPLRTARVTLMRPQESTEDQFLLVPTICSACCVESYAMAMTSTSGAIDHRRKSALRSYRKWFIAISRGKLESTLEGKISVLRQTQYADAKLARDSAAAATTTMCFTDGHEERFGSGLRSWWKKCSNDQISTVVSPNADPEISKSVKEMIKGHVLEMDEQPVQVTIAAQLSGTWEQRYTGNPIHTIPPGSADRCPGTGNTTKCSDLESAATTNAAALSTRLTANGLELMKLEALKHAADRAIAFIDKLEPSLKKETVG